MNGTPTNSDDSSSRREIVREGEFDNDFRLNIQPTQTFIKF